MTGSPGIHVWLKAIRLRTLPLALASIAMGSFLAAYTGRFDLIVFILCAITTTFLQILSNIANDYGDFVHGADSSGRLGPRRTVESGMISPRAMRKAIILVGTLSLVCGIFLLLIVFREVSIYFTIFLLLGMGAIAAALGYTMGKKPYGYAGLGDLFVMIFFGPVGVMGTYFLHTGSFSWILLLPALCSGFFATAVLNVNNIRDISSDSQAGKLSIPVRFGRRNAVRYHTFLIIAGFTLASVFNGMLYQNAAQFLYILTLPLFIRNIIEVKSRMQPAELDPSLKKLAISALLFTLLFGTGLIVSVI